jgi:hypothetical protein
MNKFIHSQNSFTIATFAVKSLNTHLKTEHLQIISVQPVGMGIYL